ncbi:MAG: 30S ribosomal protein S9 [Candidatus Woesearchaeota archaeon]
MITTSGKRKRAIARASLKKGKGSVSINGIPLENYTPKYAQMKIMEPIILIGEKAKKIDVSIRTNGGGVMSQADASRLALSRALVEFDESNEETLLDYDRKLLVADVRRRESRKPNTRGNARAKRQKSYR